MILNLINVFGETETVPFMHISVMPKEVEEGLNLPEGGTLLDCTLGLGGHSALLSKKLGPKGCIIGIDRDADSISIAGQKLSDFSGRVELRQLDFRNLDQLFRELNIKSVDGILFDLGISSFQLDNPERGFSFKSDGPLDMRMDQNGFISAYDLINSLSEQELSKIIYRYGEERYHNRIAHCLVVRRNQKPIESTQELTTIIMRAVPGSYQKQKIHPATRTFQALRIAVNRELEALEVAMDKSVDCLKVGGRIAVIAFHSLEDRIVKNKFREFAQQRKLKLIHKKPLRPTQEENLNNPRARSARLRVAERI